MKSRTMIVLGLTVPAFVAFAQPTPPAKPDSKQWTPVVTAPDSSFRDSMSAQETKVWESIAKQDWATFGAFLSDDFTDITPGGFHDKAATLASVKQGKLGRYTLSDWRTTKLGENGALVMYKLESDWTGTDGKVSHDTAYCVSTWMKQGGKWQVVAHQETSIPAKAAAPDQTTDVTKPAGK